MSNNLNSIYDVDLAIVGGGPAGVAAATIASKNGLKCLILERSDSLGGQIIKVQSKKNNASKEPEARQTAELCSLLTELGVDVITNVTIWSVDEPRILHVIHNTSDIIVKYRALLVATGARERAMPFVGWTLPGVITCGAAQRLITQSGVLPGHDVLVAGSGPLLLRAAAQLVEHGINIVGIMEATPIQHLISNGAVALFLDMRRLWQATSYMQTILKAGIRPMLGHVLLEAGGKDKIEWAISAPLDRNGQPILDKKRKWSVDAVCISNGLEPNIELLQAIGCELVYDQYTNAFYPKHDEMLKTTIPLVFVAGEVTGIGGAIKSLVEGEIAGLSAGIELGAIKRAQVGDRLNYLLGQRRICLRRARYMNLAFVTPELYLNIANPDTIICRCEEITLGELRSAISESNRSPRELKLRTRIGMGMCQGRVCFSNLYKLLISAANDPGYHLEPLQVRPPFEPVSLIQLSGYEQSESK